MNNKGLVERDHVTKKDTFYIYKAEWNDTNKFVHICGKDYTKIVGRKLKCYTNDGNSLSLYQGTTLLDTAQVTDHIAEFSERTFTAGVEYKVQGSTTYDTVKDHKLGVSSQYGLSDNHKRGRLNHHRNANDNRKPRRLHNNRDSLHHNEHRRLLLAI